MRSHQDPSLGPGREPCSWPPDHVLQAWGVQERSWGDLQGIPHPYVSSGLSFELWTHKFPFLHLVIKSGGWEHGEGSQFPEGFEMFSFCFQRASLDCPDTAAVRKACKGQTEKQ